MLPVPPDLLFGLRVSIVSHEGMLTAERVSIIQRGSCLHDSGSSKSHLQRTGACDSRKREFRKMALVIYLGSTLQKGSYLPIVNLFALISLTTQYFHPWNTLVVP